MAGRVISGLVVAFLLFDGGMKLANIQAVQDASLKLGIPAHLTLGLGVVELLCALIYAIPRTAVVGAILLTAFLGGATAAHVRAESPWYFPVILGVLAWAGLFLRDSRLQTLAPLRQGYVAPASNKQKWIGRVLSALPVPLLLFSASFKFMGGPEMDKAWANFGYPSSLGIVIGVLEVGCALLYAIPRTAVLGAMLIAAYMGGAMYTHMRIGEPYFTHPIFVALMWFALWLRDPRVRELLPLRKY